MRGAMEELAPEDPRRIGSYRLLGRLGSGGMGRVYLGRTRGGRTVAVKVVRAELADDSGFRERFRHEVEAARLVGGAWTAQVLDADTEAANPWLATGYVPGPSLHDAVDAFGPLPEESVRALGAGLAEALAAVHAAGLVHRDLKPSNVLLAGAGPRLIDFGISRAVDGTALTRTGYVVGSPGFMSPEQARATGVGPASDVFSLGAVLAFAACGEPPFGVGEPASLLFKVVAEEPDLSGVPESLRDLVAQCLIKEPLERPGPVDVLEALAPDGEAARLIGDDWLPAPVLAQIGRRSAELLDLESEADEEPTPPPPSYGYPNQPPPPGGSGGYAFPPSNGIPQDAVPPPGSFGPPTGGGSGYTAVTDMPPSAPSADRRPRRRRASVLAAIATVVAAAVAVVLALTLPGHHGTPTADTSSTSAPATATGQAAPTATAAASLAAFSKAQGSGHAVPNGFLGTWQGTVTTSDGLLSSTMTMRIRQGGVGDQVSTESSSQSLLASVAVCQGLGVLKSAGDRRIVVDDAQPPGAGNGMCTSGDTLTLSLNSDGSLHYASASSAAGSPAGDLRKVA